MANPHRGEVALGDYTLRMSINAICELEEATGKGVNEVAAQLADPDTLRLRTLRALVWAGLQEHHPGLTMAQAGDIIEDVGPQAVGVAIGEAFKAAFPQAEAAAGARPRKAKGSNRSAS